MSFMWGEGPKNNNQRRVYLSKWVSFVGARKAAFRPFGPHSTCRIRKAFWVPFPLRPPAARPATSRSASLRLTFHAKRSNRNTPGQFRDYLARTLRPQGRNFFASSYWILSLDDQLSSDMCWYVMFIYKVGVSWKYSRLDYLFVLLCV